MKYQSLMIFIIPHSLTQTLKLSSTLPIVNPEIFVVAEDYEIKYHKIFS